MHAALTLTKINRLGQAARTLPRVRVTEQPTYEMNTFGRMTFTLAPNDPDAAAVSKYDEIAVVYAGTVVWWGVVVAKDIVFEAGRPPLVTFRCADLAWYFHHRYVGKASRTNYALDPNFEADPGDPLYGAWAVNGTITFSRDGARYKLNGRSAKVVSASANEDWFIYEDILGFTATGVGDLLTVSGWFFVEDDGTFVGPAIGKRGIALVPYDGGVPSQEPPAVVNIDGALGGRTPRGSWQFGRATMWLPPDAVRDLQLRLYALGGTVRYGAIQVVRMESLSSVSSATDFTMDRAKLMELLVQHAQDPGVGKDDLNIDTDCPDVGVRVERHYQYVDHARILQALQEFPAMGGPDFWIDWTAPPAPGGVWTRTFRTAMVRGEARGLAYRVSPRLPWVKTFRHLDDGDRGRSSITLLGFGDGPDREEYGVIDTSGTGGLIVEEVLAAPVSTDIDALAGIASEQFATLSEPDVWGATVHRPDWIGVLAVGDTIPLDYSVAAAPAYQAPARIASIVLDTNTLDLGLVLNRP